MRPPPNTCSMMSSQDKRPVENVVLTTKSLQEMKHTTVGWDDGGKIVEIIN
jgi:hypothetical protein